jgi:hypothetical protein
MKKMCDKLLFGLRMRENLWKSNGGQKTNEEWKMEHFETFFSGTVHAYTRRASCE